MNLAILDRDGVINQDSKQFVKSADEWIPLPGSIEAIARLKQANWKVVIATNQSGLGRQLFSAQDFCLMQLKLKNLLAEFGTRIDGVIFCPHHPDYGCNCRKPKTGMFTNALQRFDAVADQTYSAGDSLRDLQAAHEVGCKTSLVLTGNGKKTLQNGNLPANTTIYPDLLTASQSWLQSK